MYSMKRRVTPSSRAQRAMRHDRVLVDPAADDHVDLDRRQAGLERGLDPVEHARDREVDAVHRAEHRVVERVEADRHPAQPGVGQRPRQRPQRRAVRGQGQVRRPASGVRSAASIAMRSGRSRRTSGSPPVIRSFSTPSATNARAARSISSNDRTWSRGRNA